MPSRPVSLSRLVRKVRVSERLLARVREGRLVLVVERWLLEWSRREQRAPLQEHRRAQRSVQTRLPARREDHQVQASAQAHRRERRQVQASGQVRPVVGHHRARRLEMLSCVRPPLPSMWDWTRAPSRSCC